MATKSNGAGVLLGAGARGERRGARRGLRWWQLALVFGLVDGVPHAPSARSQRHEYKRPPPELHDTGILGEVGRIYAVQFGVLADGQHDDTAALQAAIDAVNSVASACKQLLR